MLRTVHLGVLAFLVLSLVSAEYHAPAAAQEAEPEIRAGSRVLPEVGPGLIALKRDGGGRYYAAASPGNSITIFAADGKPAGQIPAAKSQGSNALDAKAAARSNAKIVFASDIDVDASGRVFVADRGANAVKIFVPGGALSIAIPVPAPTSLAALSSDEFAVTSLRSPSLFAVYADGGKMIRAVGDPRDFDPDFDPARTPDLGRLSADPAGNIYFVFSFLRVPAMRRFDRFGYAGNEIVLDEFAPSAQRRDLLSLERRSHPPATRVDALGVDPVTREIWFAVGNELLRFENSGTRIGSYRTLSPEGAPLSPKIILVEPDRLLLGTDSWGIFEFSKPAKVPAKSGAR